MQFRVERQPNKIFQSSSWIRNSSFLTTVLFSVLMRLGSWPSGLVCVVGRYKAGNVLSPCSISAGRPEVTVDFLSRQAFPLASLLWTDKPLSRLWFCFCLFADSWFNQLPNPDSYTSPKFFQSLFFFPFHSRYQSGFNDLLFSLQKLPPNLNFTAFTLFYLVPCYQMKNSKVSFVSQTSFSAQTYPIFFIIFQIK